MGENDFEAGVFIGGMNGIVDEYNMFTSLFPRAKAIAVRAGGGATATLPITYKDPTIQTLEASRDYFSLYTNILEIDPSSERIFGN